METQPYTLRRPTVKDTDACIAIHCDPRTNLYRPGGAPTVAQASSYIQAWLQHWEHYGFGYWCVAASAANQVIGFGGVMLKQVGPYHGLNLYFRLAPSVWGKGLSTFIGHAALREAFRTLQYNQVYASTRQNNRPSRRALERLGMTELETYAGNQSEQPSAIYAISRSAYESAG